MVLSVHIRKDLLRLTDEDLPTLLKQIQTPEDEKVSKSALKIKI